MIDKITPKEFEDAKFGRTGKLCSNITPNIYFTLGQLTKMFGKPEVEIRWNQKDMSVDRKFTFYFKFIYIYGVRAIVFLSNNDRFKRKDGLMSWSVNAFHNGDLLSNERIYINSIIVNEMIQKLGGSITKI